jgi:hypothetical protein
MKTRADEEHGEEGQREKEFRVLTAGQDASDGFAIVMIFGKRSKKYEFQ